MAIRRYTRSQLLALRDSPLVHKPDHLPAIEQWIEYVYIETGDGVREKLRIHHRETQPSSSTPTQSKENGGNASTTRQRPQRGAAAGLGDGASPMGSFSTGQRPSLLQMRSGASRGNNDDVSLGPPRTLFPSSSRVSKLSDFPDRASTDPSASDEPESARSRFFSDRQLNRKALNSGEKDGRDSKESWTSIRERRAMGETDDHHTRERHDRFARHDKDQDSERRNGFGDRHESRWGSKDERRQNGERTGGWREREHQRRERDNDRGHAEKEPEWMDEPLIKKEAETHTGGMARTQEEFQKWKEGMNKKSKGQPDKEDVPEVPADIPAITSVLESKPVAPAPLKLDGLDSNMFGGWASSSGKSVATPQNENVQAKSGAGKSKTSRFASMFKPAVEEPAPPSEDPVARRPEMDLPKTSLEDKEGFNRVLQMLGSVKVNQTPSQNENIPTSPPPSKMTGQAGTATRSKSRFTDIFEQKSPERLQSPPQQSGHPSIADSAIAGHIRHLTGDSIHQFGARLPERQVKEQQVPRSQAPESTRSPDPLIPFNALREQQPRPSSGRVNDPHIFSPPSRGAATPDINIQNLLAQQRQRPQATSNESQQLLNLLKKDTGSRPPSQQALPVNAIGESAQFPRWMENPQAVEPHAPKPRLPQPPGLFEEQLMRNFPSDQSRHEQTSNQDMQQRRPSQRAPPGFFDDQSMFMQQQQQQLRRNFSDVPQQQLPMHPPNPRLGAHPNLPPMQIPPSQAGGPQYPPDFHQLSSPGGGIGGPPPGFNPMMQRHPPGFHNMPNIYAQQHRDGPLPPGFGAGGGVGGGGLASAGLQSPHTGGPPPGFFPGPGMAPPPPPGFFNPRSPTDGLPPGLRGGGPGRGFEGFDPASIGLGPRR